MRTTKPALRPYLETIEKQCQPLDRDSLIQLILDLVKQLDTEKRSAFLQTFIGRTTICKISTELR